MKKNILTLATMIALGNFNAQIRTVNNATNASVTNSPAFIDASSNTTINGSSNVGKGLLFPRVDLSVMTSFPAVTAGIPNSFPTRFDGMIVYNTASSGTAGVGSTSGTLAPGFWYYENKSSTNTGGTWKPLSTAGTGVANTASNGLTLSSNDVKLGGNLTQATTVTNNGNALNIAGSASTTTFASNGYLGVGTSSPTSMLHTNGSFATQYTTVNANTTLDGTYHTVNAVHNSGTITITLPPVSTVTGRQYTIQNNNNGTTNVVVSGGGTIEGQTTLVLSQVGQTAQLIAGFSDWQLVSNAIKSVTTPSGLNIYSGDGTLNGNRIVTQNSNSLTFTGNGKVGFGITPTNKLDIDGNTMTTGSFIAGNIGVGQAKLSSAGGANPGLLEVIRANGLREGYIGFLNTGDLGFTKENGGKHRFIGGDIYADQSVNGNYILSRTKVEAIGDINSSSSVNASVSVTGQNVYGISSVTAGSAGVGIARITVGDGGHPGLMEIIRANGIREGYIGFANAGDLEYTKENGGRHRFVGGDVYADQSVNANYVLSRTKVESVGDINSSANISASSKITGQNIFGISNVTAGSAGVGIARITVGDASHPGLVEIIRASGQREGYIGFANGGDLEYTKENGGRHRFVSGDVYADQTVNANYVLSRGNIDAAGNMNISGVVKFASFGGGGNRYVYTDNSGTITAGVGYPSDVRLKTNVENLSNALEKVIALRPVSYNWKKDAQMNDHKQLGFIAQEIKKVVPEVVYVEERNGYKDLNTVNYEQLTALLTKAIQEQQSEIDTLKIENKELKNEISKIKNKLGL